MKFCMPHWEKLKQGVKDRGLWHLVSASGEAAAERMIQEIEGTETIKTYDPLLAANYAIWGQALKQGGLYLMGEDKDGNQYCPLCEAEKHGQNDWVDGCLDSILQYCRENKLTSGVS